MPARSNDFQRLVFLVKKVLEPTATVTESKSLTDRQTGDAREVDVCIEAEVGGYPMIVSMECVDHGRRADVTWVEQMGAKHSRLPTNALVLASRSGFSKSARKLAEMSGIRLLSYESVTEHDIESTFTLTGGLWALTYELTVAKAVGVVPAAGELPGERVALNPENLSYDEHGQERGTVHQVVMSSLKDRRIGEQFAREANQTHTFFVVAIEPPRYATGERVFVQKLDPLILRPLDALEIRGPCRVSRCQFQMTRGRLGPIQLAWGSGVLDGKDAMLLAVKAEGAEPTLTLHIQGPGKEPK
jgi:hypothetical protein